MIQEYKVTNIINEGIRFGEKQVNDILSRSNDFNIGIEYEFRLNDEQQYDFKDYLEDYGLDSDVDSLVPEHDDMLELITKKMPLSTALKHIKGMFDLISNKEIEVPSMAGLHVSISTNRYDLNDFNLTKFFVIMNSSYIHRMFPERKHVVDVSPIVKEVLASDNRYTSLTSDAISEIEDTIEHSISSKYQTINISEYGIRDGRIELRFFGGEDYHKQYSQIKLSVLRSLFLLEIGYTNLFKKEYYKELGKSFLPSSSKDKTEYKKYFSEKTMKELKLAIHRKSPIEVMKALLPSSGQYTYVHSAQASFHSLPKKIQTSIKNIVSDDTRTSYLFAARVFGGTFETGERVIAKDPMYAVRYAELISSRFKKAERNIFNDAIQAPNYILMLNANNLISTLELSDILIELPNDVLSSFYKKTLEPSSQNDLSFVELSSALEQSGDFQLIEPLVDIYLDSKHPEAKFNAVSLANDYHYRYSNERPLISSEKLLELIDDESLKDVFMFNYSTMLKEILRSLTISDDEVVKYIPQLKQALIDDGIWGRSESDDNMVKSSLDITFAPRGDIVKQTVDKVFET